MSVCMLLIVLTSCGTLRSRFGLDDEPRVHTTLSQAADAVWWPDGKRLVYRTVVPGRPWESEIWMVDDRGRGDSLRLTSNNVFDGEPDVFPDRDRIVFTRRTRGELQLFVLYDPLEERSERDLRGAARQLTVLGGESPSVSPDGQSVAFASRRNGSYGIYRINVSTRRVTRLVDTAEADQITPTHSADGRWIVYSDDASGSFDLRVIPAGGGPSRLLARSERSLIHPELASDGRLLVATITSDDERSRNGLWLGSVRQDLRGVDHQVVYGPAAGSRVPIWSASLHPLRDLLVGGFQDGVHWNVSVVHWSPEKLVKQGD